MSCETYRLHITRELDGTIDASHEAALMAHIADCGGCARESALQHGIRRAFARAERPIPPSGLADRIATAVLSAPRPSLWQRSLPLLRAAALLLAAGTGGWMIGSRQFVPLPEARAASVDASQQLARFQEWMTHQEPVLVRELGLDVATARRVTDIRMRHRMRQLGLLPSSDAGSAEEQMEIETAEILQALAPDLRERYWRDVVGGLPAELDRLLALDVGR